MYKAMADLTCYSERSEESHIAQGKLRGELKLRKCQVSLEVRMGCGIGACYGCTINTKKGLKQVCHDGPIFELDDIISEEVRI
jgi:NAD(P)H-flavin reductase